MILISLRYLQINDIMHRDLSPRNILVDILPGGLKILQITDFGLSKNSKSSDAQSLTLKDLTTKLYKAPEAFKGGIPTIKVDMWALGIILHELATMKLPFSNESEIMNA